MIRIILVVIALISGTCLMAQEKDGIVPQQDTLKPLAKPTPAKTTPTVKSADRIRLERMPGKAALRSAIIPGWGQLTNRRWWKVPLVYGGWVGIALVYDFNQTNYKMLLTEAQNRQFNSQNPKAPQRPVNPAWVGQYSLEGIIRAKDNFRRNRDLTILAGAAYYAVTIIDAYVDAKFFRFDITDELALKVNPALQQQPPSNSFTSPVPSVKVSMTFSK